MKMIILLILAMFTPHTVLKSSCRCEDLQQGPTGATGAAGVKGPSGQAGPVGDTGPMGPSSSGIADNDSLSAFGDYDGTGTVSSGSNFIFAGGSISIPGTAVTLGIDNMTFTFMETGTYYIHAVVYALPPIGVDSLRHFNAIQAVFNISPPTLPSTPVGYGPAFNNSDGYTLVVVQGIVSITSTGTTMVIQNSCNSTMIPFGVTDGVDTSNSISIIKLS